MLLLLSYLALYISPVKFWPIAVLGLAYPVFLLFNLFFILFWLVFLKKYFILSLLAILIGFNQIKTLIKFTGSEHKLFQENSIKVMTYNVRLFDLYNWRNESGKTTRNDIFNLIQSENPDILCLQEYYSGSRQNADFSDSIAKRSGYKFKDIQLINKETKVLPFGLAILSKYPIIHSEKLLYPNSKVNFCQVCAIKIGNDTIIVMNLHFESIKFGKEDYNFVSEITNTPSANEELKKGSRQIVSKMRNAYIRRAAQVETVSSAIKTARLPVILAGDFNDTPVSYSYRQINNDLEDTFVDSGKGLEQTHAQMLPLLRLDYIFHSRKFKTIEHYTINKDYSDHYPVVARMILPG